MAGRAGHTHRRWRLSGKKAEVEHVRNDINVTPLVDVMLVLLIIFMLMTLVMGRGKEVTLPSAKNSSSEKDKQQPVVTIEKDKKSGEVYLYVEKIKLGRLFVEGSTKVNEARLKEMQDRIEKQWKSPATIKAKGNESVYLKAAVDLTYDNIYPVLEYMNRTMRVPVIDVAIAKGGED